MLGIIAEIAQIIRASRETDEEIEQVRESIEKYLDFSKSIPKA